MSRFQQFDVDCAIPHPMPVTFVDLVLQIRDQDRALTLEGVRFDREIHCCGAMPLEMMFTSSSTRFDTVLFH